MAELYLVSKQSLTGKLARWMLLFQEFDFDIEHRTRTQHAVAGYLSRIEIGDKALEGDDDFPNGEILQILASDPPDNTSPLDDK